MSENDLVSTFLGNVCRALSANTDFDAFPNQAGEVLSHPGPTPFPVGREALQLPTLTDNG